MRADTLSRTYIMAVKYLFSKIKTVLSKLPTKTLTGSLMAYHPILYPSYSPAIRNIMAWSGVSSFMFFFFFRDFPGMSANRTL